MPSYNDSASSDHMGSSHRQHPNATVTPATRRAHQHYRSGLDPPGQSETTASTAPLHRYSLGIEPPLPQAVAFSDTTFDHHAPAPTQQFDHSHRDRHHALHVSEYPPPFGRQSAHARSASLHSYADGNYSQELPGIWPAHASYPLDDVTRPVALGYQPSQLQTPDHHSPVLVPDDRYSRESTTAYDSTYQTPPAWPSQHPVDERLESSTYQYANRRLSLTHSERVYNPPLASSAPSTSHRIHSSLPPNTPHPQIASSSSSALAHQSHEHGVDATESDMEKDSSVYRCHICSTTCSRKTDLLRHIRDRHSTVPHKEVCPYCGIEVGRMDALRRHIRVTCKLNPNRRVEGADQDAAGKKKGKERKKNDE